MRKFILISTVAATLIAAPAMARQERPMTDRDPNAMDVAKTPVTDLNIDKQEIPDLLIRAQQKPYDLGGLDRCHALGGAVEELDNLLGPDIDLPQQERDRLSAGRVAQTVVGSFIPFRGLIREVSGANDHQRRVQAAIQAGLTRRGFLKGIGAQRGCRYPASPATEKVIADYRKQLDEAEQQAATRKASSSIKENTASSQPSGQTTQNVKPTVTMTSKPVVQEID